MFCRLLVYSFLQVEVFKFDGFSFSKLLIQIWFNNLKTVH